MFRVVLFEPEIPPNVGNIIRLCANVGAELHLVGRLGFSLDEPRLRRAGLDYREWVRVRHHPEREWLTSRLGEPRLLAFTTRGRTRPDETRFAEGDWLVFGPESRGLPGQVLAAIGPERRLRLPMRPGSRSINLSNAVAMALYEAWRQLGFRGAGDAGPAPQAPDRGRSAGEGR